MKHGEGMKVGPRKRTTTSLAVRGSRRIASSIAATVTIPDLRTLTEDAAKLPVTLKLRRLGFVHDLGRSARVRLGDPGAQERVADGEDRRAEEDADQSEGHQAADHAGQDE